MASFASVARRVAQMSSSVFEAPQIIDYDEVSLANCLIFQVNYSVGSWANPI